jgi:hypothetical protein
MSDSSGEKVNFGIIINPSQRGFLLFRQVERASTDE